ncbi:MAG: CHAP domain-containing protein [Oscillospiraceae bacterium]|nr:CHAP domain-containing protein [Oscillospiraceae bacterium]
MTAFPEYTLSDSAIKDIAECITGETGGADILACRQEASQMCNLNEITYGRQATEADILKTLHGGWYSKNSWGKGVTQTAIDAVKFVMVMGNRVLPRYVTEHDWFPNDIINPKARNKYNVGDDVENKYDSKYQFYTFFGANKDGDIAGYFKKDYEKYKDDVPYGGETMANAIDKVIEIAEDEVGYLEKRSDSQLDDKTANVGSSNYTKYWRDIAPEYQGEPWCAGFITWVFVKAFGKDMAEKLLKHYPYVYCPTMADLFTLHANPMRGDIVIFYRNGEFVHTGIVTSVNGDYFTTVEGNTSGGSTIIENGGGVYKKGYYNSNLPGTKFCRPDYSIIEMEDLTMTQYEELKQEIKTLKEENQRLMDTVESTFVYNYNDENIPDWARPALKAAMDSGAVRGDEKGQLHLNYKDLRTIVREYRCGLYDK